MTAAEIRAKSATSLDLSTRIDTLITNIHQDLPYYYVNKKCCKLIKILKDLERNYLKCSYANEKTKLVESCLHELKQDLTYLSARNLLKNREATKQVIRFTQAAIHLLDNLSPKNKKSFPVKSPLPFPAQEEQIYKPPKAKL